MKNTEETETSKTEKEKVEFIDSDLLRSLGLAIATYFLTYSILSLLFGNQFAAFVATPLSALAYFLTARWDRLREAKSLSTENLKALVRIDPVIVFYSLPVFFILETLSVSIFAVVLMSFDPDLGEAAFSEWPSQIDQLDPHFGWELFLYSAALIPYFLGGLVAGRIARRRKVSAPKHAVVSALAFIFLNLILQNIYWLSTTGDFFLPEDDETPFGVPVMVVSLFGLLPLLGGITAMRLPMREKNLSDDTGY